MRVDKLYDTIIFTCGEVPKRPKGADSKSARRVKPCVGSNPTFSAIILNIQRFLQRNRFFVSINGFGNIKGTESKEKRALASSLPDGD